ncbi:uncharacterized protein GIQ15_04212 [Arthroderma uncinatum]|uniref:uncharacterized protein n=1 Tax=Arthroderma uncinatum TaxID=74035 RepID=UPI00144AB076|nr:uncharacterized protein GIQ15_04212 [Arthroderma uncinatum]KAF3481453.1 hypothetical protein GIQ15_04212 [Arthroderma uncinatum]
MDPLIVTPRLKLTLLTKAERGSPEFKWLHELHSNEKSIVGGRARSMEDAEMNMTCYLPTNKEDGLYRIAYAVHRILDSTETPTEFIGLVTLRSLDANCLPLPEELTLPAAAAATILTVEIAYSFLPAGWGKGYATESVKAMFECCRRAQSFWAPFSKVYVRAIVNGENGASARVMEKTGMVKRGVYEWKGKAVLVGGRWRERDSISIFGMHLLGGEEQTRPLA